MQIDLNIIGGKLAYIVLTSAGAGLTVFNILAFKATKGTVYYQDVNQTWAMIGVLLILAGYFVKNWKEL